MSDRCDLLHITAHATLLRGCDPEMNKKETLLQAYARVKRLVRRSRAPGCDNNVILSVEEHREEKSKRLRNAGESFKFSAEVARCRDTDCKRYRLSKFGETVSRRSGGVSEGNFHPLRVYSFSACEHSTARRLLHPLRGNSRQRPPVIGATFVASELHFH